MQEIISKQEFDALMKIEGEVRGLGFKTEAKFILEKEGEEGVKKLEQVMAELGYPHNEIKPMDFYPIGLLAVALLAIKRLFLYQDEQFREMGKFEAKSSLLIRLFMKYFVSLDRMVSETQNVWKKYYTIGKLYVKELNKEKKYVIITLENFTLHPILCQVLVGYFISVVKMIVKSEPSCKETKCVHQGSDYHEFLIEW